MTTTRKSLRFLTVLALIFAMVLSMASIPASAAGVETWYATDNVIYENDFTIRGYNLTPVKTIGSSGNLLIGVDVDLTDGKSDPAIITVEIRLSNGTVLNRGTISTSVPWPHLQVEAPVTAGQKVQIYIGVYTNGVYRVGTASYYHRIYDPATYN